MPLENPDEKIAELLAAAGLCSPEWVILPERALDGPLLDEDEFERRLRAAIANRFKGPA